MRLNGLLSVYRLDFPKDIVYMLQATEYDLSVYLRWLWRVSDFSKVMHRRTLVKTKPARLLLAALRLGMLCQIGSGAYLLYLANQGQADLGMALSALFILATPIVWAHLIILPLVLGRWLIVKPGQWRKIKRSEAVFQKHPGVKIAIAGSYGKTTMKEILLTVLSEGKKVKATPANKNVEISHALFAQKLKGDEDVLIIEYGEGRPGDVARFAKTTHPTAGVITGLAPAHLDKYKTLAGAARDIFSLTDYLKNKSIFVNGDSVEARPFLKKEFEVFSEAGVAGWKVNGVKSDIKGLSFTIDTGNGKLKIRSRLIGRHQIGPLSLAAYLGHQYGLTDRQIESGIAKIEPFEHRMKPYQLSGAWIIDDTYNGNIDGMKVGLNLLKELKAKRKIYVTPGLVDQGAESEQIHQKLGELITQANPDKVVLMKHSVTDSIVNGLKGYKGQLIIEDDPLNFYKNLDKFVAAGDLVLMQNDWPDNYN